MKEQKNVLKIDIISCALKMSVGLVYIWSHNTYQLSYNVNELTCPHTKMCDMLIC